MASSRDYEDPISARLENHISTGVSAPTGFEIQFIKGSKKDLHFYQYQYQYIYKDKSKK